MWIAAKLLFSGVFDLALKGLSSALQWLLSDWRHLVIVSESAVLGWVLGLTVPSLRADVVSRDRAIVTVTLERDAEQAAHLGTVNAFLAASKQAQKEAEANAQRVARQQEAITDEVVTASSSDLAALRNRFDRLRASAARTDPGGADPAGLPGSGNAPGRAADAAPDHDLSAAGDLTFQPVCPIGLVCLTIDEAEAASEDAHRHNRLIDWVIRQSAVRFNPEVEP